MAALLGARVALCCALGGESGAVLRGLVERENVELLAVECASPNGVYVHVRRDGNASSSRGRAAAASPATRPTSSTA